MQLVNGKYQEWNGLESETKSARLHTRSRNDCASCMQYDATFFDVEVLPPRSRKDWSTHLIRAQKLDTACKFTNL